TLCSLTLLLVFRCFLLSLLFDNFVLFLISLIVLGCLVCLTSRAGCLLASSLVFDVMFCNYQDLYILLCNFLLFFVNCSSALLNISLVDVFRIFLFLKS